MITTSTLFLPVLNQKVYAFSEKQIIEGPLFSYKASFSFQNYDSLDIISPIISDFVIDFYEDLIFEDNVYSNKKDVLSEEEVSASLKEDSFDLIHYALNSKVIFKTGEIDLEDKDFYNQGKIIKVSFSISENYIDIDYLIQTTSTKKEVIVSHKNIIQHL